MLVSTVQQCESAISICISLPLEPHSHHPPSYPSRSLSLLKGQGMLKFRVARVFFTTRVAMKCSRIMGGCRGFICICKKLAKWN